MKGKDDDLPEKGEKQGRPDRKQPVLTLAQVKKVVEEALESKLSTLTEKLSSHDSGFRAIGVEIKSLAVAINDSGAANVPQALVDLNAKVERSIEMIGEAKGAVDLVARDIAGNTGALEEIRNSNQTGFGNVSGLLDSLGLESSTRHEEVLERFGAVDTELKNTRSDINAIDKKINDLVERAGRLEDALVEVLKQGSDLKTLALDIQIAIGIEGDDVRSATAGALETMAGFLIDQTGKLVRASESKVVGSLNNSVIQLVAAVNNVPGLLGGEFMGRFAQIVTLADTIAKGGEQVSQHLMTLSESTTAAFGTHQMLVRSMKAEFNNQMVGLGTMIEERTESTFNTLEKRIDKSFTEFDQSDVKHNLETMKDLMSYLQSSYAEFDRLTNDLSEFRGGFDAANTNLRNTVDKKSDEVVKAMGQVAPAVEQVKKYVDTAMAGIANAEGAATALVNRISAVSLEAYRRDLDALSEISVQDMRDAESRRLKDRQEDMAYLKDFMQGLLMEQAAAFAKAVIDAQDAEILADDLPDSK